MKTALAALVTWSIPFSFCAAQNNPALQMGTSAGFSAVYGFNARAAIEMSEWKASKRLTTSKDVLDVTVRQEDCMSPASLSTGQIGWLDAWQFKVSQVIGKQDVLVTMGNPKMPPLWLTGFATDDLVDGEKVRFVGPVEVTGTKTYESEFGGQRTVRVVRLLTAEETAQHLESRKAARRAAKQQELDKVEAEKRQLKLARRRQWSTSDGKYKVDANFVFAANGSVVLEKDNGTRVTVPLKRLCADDQAFIREKKWMDVD